jgi:hypothetical protein
MRRLNIIPVRRKLNPPTPPVEDWQPSDFATDPAEAWCLADEEIEAEEAAAPDDGR